MTAPWEVTKKPPIADVIGRLRQQAEHAARANNYATGTKDYKPEDFQSWHDAAAIAAIAAIEER